MPVSVERSTECFEWETREVVIACGFPGPVDRLWATVIREIIGGPGFDATPRDSERLRIGLTRRAGTNCERASERAHLLVSERSEQMASEKELGR